MSFFRIKCPIHRFITVPVMLQPFLHAFECQKLRNIKQLGFVSYVYPSAVHTRFEHSLGVMQKTGDLIQHLRQFWHIPERTGHLVMLGGLYHDIGHAAYSHFLESVIPHNHEKAGVEILRDVNQRLGSPLKKAEVDFVTGVILGVPVLNAPPFLFQIVHHSLSHDVDRLDYLARDALHCGLPAFQSDYILNCAQLTQDKERPHLTYLPKAAKEIERVDQVRTYMFSTVYRHKAVLKVEAFVKRLIEEHKIPISATMDDVDFLMALKTYAPEGYVALQTRQWAGEKGKDKQQFNGGPEAE